MVYSCLAPASSTSTLPPPTALPTAMYSPLSNPSACNGEGSLVPVVVGGVVSTPQVKGQANSGLTDTKPEEFARPSAKASDVVVASVVSSLAPPTVCSLAPPFPSSTSMPPPVVPPPMHASQGFASNASSPGGGKQPCYYVYPSSAGYPAPMPPATPPGGNPAAQGALSQGQVVYVMNPQSFGPPCTAYQPSMMAPPTGVNMGMAMPCPPVAVQ